MRKRKVKHTHKQIHDAMMEIMTGKKPEIKINSELAKITKEYKQGKRRWGGVNDKTVS